MNSSIHCLTPPKATLLERPSPPPPRGSPHTYFGPSPCYDIEGQDHHMAKVKLPLSGAHPYALVLTYQHFLYREIPSFISC